MTEYTRPNWQNESEYTDHGDDLLAWAWEFLRRNRSYQLDYARWAALPDTIIDKGMPVADLRRESLSPKFDNVAGEWVQMIFCMPSKNLPALEGETVGEYEKRTGQWPQTLYEALPENWGIFELADPASDNAPGPHHSDVMPPYVPYMPGDIFDFGQRNGVGMEWATNRCLVAPWPAEIDQHIHTLSFDLRYSISDQLEAARMMLADVLSNSKERRETPQVGKLLSCLRVYDAHLADASPEEIIDELYDGKDVKTTSATEASDEMIRLKAAANDWIDENFKRAQGLVAEGYRNLLKWSQLPPKKKKVPPKAMK